MTCSNCGAPATAGTTVCDYCGQPLASATSAAPAASMGTAAGPAAAGQDATGAGATPAGNAARALGPDGCWAPVACSAVANSMYLVRFANGRQVTVSAKEVRYPCEPEVLKPGTPVRGEYQGRYYPGTVVQADKDQRWLVQFDDGEQAALSRDQLCTQGAPLPPVEPGTSVVAQQADGAWYPGRVTSGPDQSGRQMVRLAQGGQVCCSRAQLNGAPSAVTLQEGARVMGLGQDGYWYPGTIRQLGQGGVFIAYDDGDEAWTNPFQVRSIERC